MNLWIEGMDAKYNQYTVYGERWKYITFILSEHDAFIWNGQRVILQNSVPYN